MVTCELCGRQFKNTQGLRGHKTFIHGDGSPSNTSAAHAATEQQLSKLEDRLQNLERVTGLRESDLLDSPTDGQLPITEQLGQLTQQLSQLTQQLNEQTQQVNKLSEDVEMTQVAKALSDKCLAQLDKG